MGSGYEIWVQGCCSTVAVSYRFYGFEVWSFCVRPPYALYAMKLRIKAEILACGSCGASAKSDRQNEFYCKANRGLSNRVLGPIIL